MKPLSNNQSLFTTENAIDDSGQSIIYRSSYSSFFCNVVIFNFVERLSLIILICWMNIHICYFSHLFNIIGWCVGFISSISICFLLLENLQMMNNLMSLLPSWIALNWTRIKYVYSSNLLNMFQTSATRCWTCTQSRETCKPRTHPRWCVTLLHNRQKTHCPYLRSQRCHNMPLPSQSQVRFNLQSNSWSKPFISQRKPAWIKLL